MRKLIGYCLCVAALWLGTVTNGLAGGGTFTRGCAGRDIQIMMMLETSAMTSQQLDEAMRTIVHARMMCFDGQVMDALGLYEQIAQTVASAWILSRPDRDLLN
ncbi:MAG: hypothetical protein GEU95_19665 [Rhizobiales bacterium]|nr:hypothetical protein [Hyphomicrobiales bacterium]